MLALDTGLAVRVYLDVRAHGAAADRAAFNVVLMRAGRDIYRHDDFFAAGIADIHALLMHGFSGSAAFLLGLLFHDRRGFSRKPWRHGWL